MDVPNECPKSLEESREDQSTSVTARTVTVGVPETADDAVAIAREVFGVPTHGGARGKRGKNKKVVFEAAFSGTTEDYQEVLFPLLVSLEAIPRV